MAVNKKQNFIVRYFTPFGLRQICDIIMVVGGILLIVGLFNLDSVMLAGLICYVVGSAISLVRCCLVLFSKTINHRDPVYKSTIINTVIMGVLFALAVFGMVWSIVM